MNEHLFVNRHQRHSMNVRAVCNTNMTFANMVARFPGSVMMRSLSRNAPCGQQLSMSKGIHGYLLALGDRALSITTCVSVKTLVHGPVQAEGNPGERTITSTKPVIFLSMYDTYSVRILDEYGCA